jgi:hypothetical protein
VDQQPHTQTATEVTVPKLPDPDLQVDFGFPAPGSSNPMPIERRTEYEDRIRRSVDAQAAGAERASELFIR